METKESKKGNRRRPTIRGDTDQVSAAIVRATESVGHVTKTRVAGLPYEIISDAAVLKAVRTAVIDAGLAFVPSSVEVVVNESSGKMRHMILLVTYAVMHRGQSIRMESLGEAMDSSDKCVAKCLTMARKSLFRTLFMLESDDPDFDRPTEPAPF